MRSRIFCLLGLPCLFAGSLVEGEESVETSYSITVLDSDAKPVAGADVWIWENRDNAADPEDLVRAHGLTGEDGVFSGAYICLEKFRKKYITMMARQGDRVGTRLVYFFPAEADEVLEGEISLGESQVVRVRLIDEHGDPVEGVKLHVSHFYAPDWKGIPFSGAPELRGAWSGGTNADGRAVIEGMPAGYRAYLAHNAADYAALPGYHSVIEKGILAGGEEKTFQLAPGAAVSGRVELPDGTPIAQARVRLIEHSPYVSAYSSVVLSGEDGRFVLDRVPTGKYRVYSDVYTSDYSHKEWKGGNVEELFLDEAKPYDIGTIPAQRTIKITARIIDAETGKEVEDPLEIYGLEGQNSFRYRSYRMPPDGYGDPLPESVEVVLKEGQPQEVEFRLPPVQGYEGQVVDEAGVPVPKAVVLAHVPHASAFPRHIVSDDEGRYTFYPSEIGRSVALVAWSPDGKKFSSPLMIEGWQYEGTRLELQDDCFASIKGKVLDQDGEPVSDVMVTWKMPSGFWMDDTPLEMRVSTGVDGVFEFPRVFAGLDLSISAKRKGFHFKKVEKFNLASGIVHVVNLESKLADRILEGRVSTHRGELVSGAHVNAVQGSVYENTMSDSKGTFRLEDLLRNQPFRLTAIFESGEWSGEVSKWIKGEDDGPFDLVFPEADGRITGQLLYHDGAPASGIEVSLISARRKTKTDKEGRFEISGFTEKGWTTLGVHPFGEGRRAGYKSFRIKVGTDDSVFVISKEVEESQNLPLKERNLIGTAALPVRPVWWLNTDPIASEKPKGVVRILDFWGPSCGPCLSAFPKVDKFWRQHGGREDLQFVALVGDTNRAEIEELISDNKYTFPVGMMADGDSYWRDWDIRGVPTYVVIDQENEVVSYGHDWNEASAVALKLLD